MDVIYQQLTMIRENVLRLIRKMLCIYCIFTCVNGETEEPLNVLNELHVISSIESIKFWEK